MKNGKGFTLVELIGTLVVLSIIILLATTNVFNNMTKSSKKTEKLAAKNYVTAINDYNHMSNEANKVCGEKTVSIINSTIKDAISGKLPKSGTVTISCTTYEVTQINIVMNKYTVKFSTTGSKANKYVID